MHPHIESLTSIKVFPFGGEDLNIQHSFRDLIVLADIQNKKYLDLKACFFINSKLKKINPIYESFKRIKMVYCNNYEDAFIMFNKLKQTSIQEIEEINFIGMNIKDFENIIDQLLNYKIHTLKYDFFDSLKSISNQMFENISKINLQKLHQLILNI